MKRILIPCYSNTPDREHDAVVLEQDDKLLAYLEANRRAFDLRALQGPDLYAHEYRGGPLSYLKLEDDVIDAPSGPITLETHLRELEYRGPWSLKAIGGVYLKVVKEGLFYNWEGRREKYGPSETYETHVFTPSELKGAD